MVGKTVEVGMTCATTKLSADTAAAMSYDVDEWTSAVVVFVRSDDIRGDFERTDPTARS